MTELNLNDIVEKNLDVSYTHIDDDMVVIGEDGLFHGVNAVGTQIWSLLETGATSLRAICDYLLQHYDTNEEQCVADVKTFVKSLMAQKMVTIKMAA